MEAKMNDVVLFKYRSMQNWKYLLDIFLRKRLYAATYRELNDPMEGRFFYHNDKICKEFLRAIHNQRREWRICSLSRNHRNTLMWSYYADGHRGIAVGIRVKNPGGKDYTVKPVDYDMELHLDKAWVKDGPEQVTLHVLSQKQTGWRHEDEVRVFSRNTFVNVEIEKVCFGVETKRKDRDLISALVKTTAPDAELVQLKREQLDKPLEDFLS
jgi:hypothetical protein